MKRAYFFSLFLVLTPSLLSQSNPVSRIHQTASVPSSITASQPEPQAQAKILDGYGKLPLSFEANQGQTDARVKFLSRTGGYSLFLTGDEAVLVWSEKSSTKRSPPGLRLTPLASLGGTAEAMPLPRIMNNVAHDRTTGTVVRMKLRNANPAAKVTGVDELPGTSNYFIGNDPAKWRTKVPIYAKVKYEGIYPGIDLIYYGKHRQLEYDFIVAPGTDPRRIAFEVNGAKGIRRDARGDLVLKAGESEIRWHKPVVYQEKDGGRQLVAADYVVTNTNRVGFELAKYDTSRAVYIDPLIYSTYLGGNSLDSATGIAVDDSGNAYVVGATCSTDFPTTAGAFQTAYGGGNIYCSSGGDAFVTKINPTGSALVYSTYLGGGDGDGGSGIAVDSTGNAYVTGATGSTNFPVTPGAFQTTYGGSGDAFVTKINPTGSALVYSTYLGGGDGDSGSGIAVNSAGNAYVVGTTGSTDFPVTPGAFQTTYGGSGDAFVTKINPTGSAVVYSTYLGGSNGDYGSGVVVNSAGNAYVTGFTHSTDFPVTPSAFQTACGGGCYEANNDAFVTKINLAGSALAYSTYLGGSVNDFGSGIGVDSAGNAYITGRTASTDFPITPGAFQTGCNSAAPFCDDAFVTKLNPSGSALVYSTYLGGGGGEGGNSVAVDSAGNAYITGVTGSTHFPTVTPLQSYLRGPGDAFVTKIAPAGSALVYSTYLGGGSTDDGLGVALDSARNAYVTGSTCSINFPTRNPLQAGNAGKCDAFVTKLDVRAVPIITLTSSLNPSTYGQAVTFIAALTSSIGTPPDGETIAFKKDGTLWGTGTLRGGLASFTTSMLPAGARYIKAVYDGDANFRPSTSKALKQVVNTATTTTTLTSSLNPSSFGQAVTFTAKVTPQYTGMVHGYVTFYDGTTALKTKSLSGGVAQYTTPTLVRGIHSITATYNGGTNFLGSSASLTQTVN